MVMPTVDPWPTTCQCWASGVSEAGSVVTTRCVKGKCGQQSTPYWSLHFSLGRRGEFRGKRRFSLIVSTVLPVLLAQFHASSVASLAVGLILAKVELGKALRSVHVIL